MVTLTLLWPPSTNRLWRRVGNRTLLSRDGRAYKTAVRGAVLEQLGTSHPPLQGAVSVRLALHPPDRRRRDIDNTLKAVFDALTWSAVWKDDSQVKALQAELRDPVPGGRCEVEVVAL